MSITARPILNRSRYRRSGGGLVVALGITWAAAFLVISGCGGAQSTLEPAGRGAEVIAELFWWLAGGAAIVWILVIALAVYAGVVKPHSYRPRTAKLLILGGGVLFPTLVLGGYLSYSLALLPPLIEPAPEGSLEIHVSGEQWWWRVHYLTPGGDTVTVANEIWLPVNEPVQFYVNSRDVIHSFWIPALGGKIDMIPGRTNRLTLEPTREGVYRGVCAEYCGASHALMAFDAVVTDRATFDDWLAHQASAARQPVGALPARGRQLFFENGCGACHTVRGTEAAGKIGPDLTHVGGRLRIGAGTLVAHVEAFHEWIANPGRLKPEAKMPHFEMLAPADLRALAAYLVGLE